MICKRDIVFFLLIFANSFSLTAQKNNYYESCSHGHAGHIKSAKVIYYPFVTETPSGIQINGKCFVSYAYFDYNGNCLKEMSELDNYMILYQYNANNNLIECLRYNYDGSKLQSNGTYIYDSFGRKIKWIYFRDEGETRTTKTETTEYYPNGNIKGIYFQDEDGETRTTETDTMEYYPNGNIKEHVSCFTYGNSEVTYYSLSKFNSYGNRTMSKYYDKERNTLSTTTFKYNGKNKILSAVTITKKDGILKTGKEIYSYDSITGLLKTKYEYENSKCITKETYKYDEKKNITEYCCYKTGQLDKKEVYTWINGKKKEMKEYSSKGFVEKIVYNYDDKGGLCNEKSYNIRGELTSSTDYSKDSEITTFYDSNGDEKSCLKILYTYDKCGRRKTLYMVKKNGIWRVDEHLGGESVDNNGNKTEDVNYRYVIQYDQNGEWVKRYIFDRNSNKLERLCVREIEYY